MHRPLFVITAGSVAACGALIFASALPAAAATAGRAETMALYQNGPGTSEDTPVTFAVTTNGTLNVTVPSAILDLGSGLVGATLGPAALGPVTVTDYRATDPSNWTALVSSSDFVNQTIGDSGDTIPADAATYLIPAITVDDRVTTPGSVDSGLPLATGIVDDAASAITFTGGTQTVVVGNRRRR